MLPVEPRCPPCVYIDAPLTYAKSDSVASAPRNFEQKKYKTGMEVLRPMTRDPMLKKIISTRVSVQLVIFCILDFHVDRNETEYNE